VDEGTVPNVGKAAFHEGRSGGEGVIRTRDGVAPEPHFQFALEEGSEIHPKPHLYRTSLLLTLNGLWGQV